MGKKVLILFPVLSCVKNKKLNQTDHVTAFVAHIEEFGNHIRAVIGKNELDRPKGRWKVQKIEKSLYIEI